MLIVHAHLTIHTFLRCLVCPNSASLSL
uniref:Uncharacterized protein n=1 Tax=Anguilla anguilla TaxID=7936 RepID=A0A0E9V6M3_ANGAN